MNEKFTPGPWQYVEGTEHHGPYVTNDFGTTIADLYAMSNPSALSVRNGGDSKPIVHMAEMADPNARLIATSPKMYETLAAIDAFWTEDHPLGPDTPKYGPFTFADDTIALWRKIRAVLAEARGDQQ